MSNLTSNQETFCLGIFEGKTQYDAYCLAYPDQSTEVRNTIDSNASQLMGNTKIIQRLEELRKPLIKQSERTLETILQEINKLKEAGIEDKDLKLALDCLKHEAKLRGFEINKTKDMTDYSGILDLIKKD